MGNKGTITVTGEPRIRRKFQQTNLGDNHNKWYMVEAWDAAGGLDVRISYGRVGGATAVDEYPAVQPGWVERKIREKLRPDSKGKCYHEIALAEVSPASAPVTALVRTNDPVDTLVARLFREAGEQIKSYLAVAVDALGQAQIQQGRQLLQDAQRAWAAFNTNGSRTSSQADELVDVVQRFYNAIPTQLPRRIDPWIVTTEFCSAFAEQEDRLNQLEAAIATQAAGTGQVTQLSALGCDMALLDPRSDVAQKIAAFVTSTAVHGYRVKVAQVFEVRIPAERAAYEACPIGKERRELLFHGTAAGNMRHILRSGLIVPRTAANGRAFGDGIYFATKSTKSINYCTARHGGNVLMLAEVAVGKFYTPRSNSEVGRAKSAPSGYDSVWAIAGKTGYIQYDEVIVYQTSQQTIRYVVVLA